MCKQQRTACQNPLLISMQDTQNRQGSFVLRGSRELSLCGHKIVGYLESQPLGRVAGTQARTGVCSLHVLLHSERQGRGAIVLTGPAVFTFAVHLLSIWFVASTGVAPASGSWGQKRFPNLRVLS